MIENETQRMHSRCWHKSKVPGYWSKQRPRMRLKKVMWNAMRVILLTQYARRSENLVAKKVICFLPSSYFSATQQGVDTDEAKTNSLASCKTTHLPTNCLYLELFILFCSACSKQSKHYCRLSEQKRYLSIYLKPYGHTPQLYRTCAPRTLHVLRHKHTPYAHPVRTVHDSCAHRTRKPRAPCARTARTVRTQRAHRTHTPHAHAARPVRTPRTHTPHITARPVRTPSRTRTLGYKSKPCSHHSWI